MEMAGFSLTLMLLDKERVEYLGKAVRVGHHVFNYCFASEEMNTSL
jgi:hypothetical protein